MMTPKSKIAPVLDKDADIQVYNSKSIQETTTTPRIPQSSYILFNIVTDYTTLILMACKLYFALKFGVNLVFAGQMDEEFILDKQG